MSALPKAKQPPKPRRTTQNQSMYRGKTAAQVQSELREHSFSGIAILPDIWYVARNAAQLVLITSIYTHTKGCPNFGKIIEDCWHEPRKKSERFRKPEYTPAMLTEDFSKETGIPRQALAYIELDGKRESSIEDLVSRGVIDRKCRCGKDRPKLGDRKTCPEGADHYRYKILLENWTNPGARVVDPAPPRKPVQSEGLADGEEIENPQVRDLTSEEIVVVERKRVIRFTPGKRYDIASAKVEAIECDEDVPPIAAKVEGDGVMHIRRAKIDQSKSDQAKAEVIPMPKPQPDPAVSGNGAGHAASPAPPTRGAPSSGRQTAPAFYALISKLKHVDEEDAGRLANSAAAVDLSQFPVLTKAVRGRYADTDDRFLQILVAVAQDACSVAKVRCADQWLAEGIAACVRKQQTGAGLYLNTLPAWIAREARGDGEEPKPAKQESPWERRARETNERRRREQKE